MSGEVGSAACSPGIAELCINAINRHSELVGELRLYKVSGGFRVVVIHSASGGFTQGRDWPRAENALSEGLKEIPHMLLRGHPSTACPTSQECSGLPEHMGTWEGY